ncbi:hypothetical protein BTO09_03600 [Gilvibacter sp. SZ-19]|uniref:hypothetical protein n=1 Tax=Gilvibacter sp. SZ-19 TaxID=754429 RepID=UPI000B3D377D|nr:hypothetical protein [Gilvibacter sp. SZ-19]ARV11478.1 hypothetical protein BTO09_03600 [Gilvibacter sp. SZ-19]
MNNSNKALTTNDIVSQVLSDAIIYERINYAMKTILNAHGGQSCNHWQTTYHYQGLQTAYQLLGFTENIAFESITDELHKAFFIALKEDQKLSSSDREPAPKLAKTVLSNWMKIIRNQGFLN